MDEAIKLRKKFKKQQKHILESLRLKKEEEERKAKEESEKEQLKKEKLKKRFISNFLKLFLFYSNLI